MVTFTEGRHAAEFILSEANGQRSRENGVLLAGQKYEAGTVLMPAGGKLVAYELDSDGTEAVGILIDTIDATEADQPCAYLARDAEVNVHLLVGPGDSEGDEAMVVSLRALGIIAR